MSGNKFVDIQTSVTIDKSYVRMEDHVEKVAMHISIDPFTNIKECKVFTDDGRGNGVCIFHFEME